MRKFAKTQNLSKKPSKAKNPKSHINEEESTLCANNSIFMTKINKDMQEA